MKLYTEYHLKEMYFKGLDNCKNHIQGGCHNAIDSLTPIELPSDEDIKSYSDKYSTMHEDVSDKLGKYLVYAIHTDGAKWIKEQILNQNK